MALDDKDTDSGEHNGLADKHTATKALPIAVVALLVSATAIMILGWFLFEQGETIDSLQSEVSTLQRNLSAVETTLGDTDDVDVVGILEGIVEWMGNVNSSVQTLKSDVAANERTIGDVEDDLYAPFGSSFLFNAEQDINDLRSNTERDVSDLQSELEYFRSCVNSNNRSIITWVQFGGYLYLENC